MKPYLLIVTLLTVTPFAVAQEPTPTPTPPTATDAAGKEQGTVVNPGLVVVRPSTGYVRPDSKTRSKRFLNSMVGPFALGRNVAKAGIATWRNSPEEWGSKWEGFGRRVASGIGKNAIKQTTIYGLDEAFELDSHFYRSKNKSVGARVRNALISPVTARNSRGKRVIGFPRLAGTYASNIISREAWYPDRYDWKDGVRSGTISLGFNAAFNLVKEFIWKK